MKVVLIFRNGKSVMEQDGANSLPRLDFRKKEL